MKRVSINFSLEKGCVEFDEALMDRQKILEISTRTLATALLRRAKNRRPQHIARKEKFPFFFALALTVPLVVLMYGMHLLNFDHAQEPPMLFLFFPRMVQFVSGITFYSGAYHSLKNRSTNMDVLIALGISAAYFYSVFSLFYWGLIIPPFLTALPC